MWQEEGTTTMPLPPSFSWLIDSGCVLPPPPPICPTSPPPLPFDTNGQSATKLTHSSGRHSLDLPSPLHRALYIRFLFLDVLPLSRRRPLCHFVPPFGRKNLIYPTYSRRLPRQCLFIYLARDSFCQYFPAKCSGKEEKKEEEEERPSFFLGPRRASPSISHGRSVGSCCSSLPVKGTTGSLRERVRRSVGRKEEFAPDSADQRGGKKGEKKLPNKFFLLFPP